MSLSFAARVCLALAAVASLLPRMGRPTALSRAFGGSRAVHGVWPLAALTTPSRSAALSAKRIRRSSR